MQPQQPYVPPPQQPVPPPLQPMPPSPPGPQQPAPDYGFIFDPPKPPKRSLLSGGSKLKRVGVVAVGVLLLLIVFSVLKSVLVGSDVSTPTFMKLAQQQQAMVKLSGSGILNAQSTATRNFSVTAKLTLTSEQQQIIAYLKSNHHKVSAKNLNLLVNKSESTELTTAVSTNNFDETYAGLMKKKLDAYQHTLEQAQSVVKGPKGQALIQSDLEAVKLLEQQLGS